MLAAVLPSGAGIDVAALLGSGRAVVLLDGLDEMLPDLLSQAPAWLKSWKDHWPEVRWVYSTRPIADAVVPGDVPRAFLKPLSDAEAERLLRQLLPHVGGPEAFVSAIRAAPQFDGFLQTPLFLTLLARVFAETSRLPQGRTDVFTTLVDLVLRGADKGRVAGARGESRSGAAARRFLSEVALDQVRRGSVFSTSIDIQQLYARTVPALAANRGGNDAFEVLLRNAYRRWHETGRPFAYWISSISGAGKVKTILGEHLRNIRNSVGVTSGSERYTSWKTSSAERLAPLASIVSWTTVAIERLLTAEVFRFLPNRRGALSLP